METLNRLSQGVESAIRQLARLRAENGELKAALAHHAAEAQGARAQLEARLAEALALVERLREQPPADEGAVERARRAELEAANLAQDLESLRQKALSDRQDWEAKLDEARSAATRERLRAEEADRQGLALQQELEQAQRAAREADERMRASAADASEASAEDLRTLQARLAASEQEAAMQRQRAEAAERSGQALSLQLEAAQRPAAAVAEADELRAQLEEAVRIAGSQRQRAEEAEKMLEEALAMKPAPPVEAAVAVAITADELAALRAELDQAKNSLAESLARAEALLARAEAAEGRVQAMPQPALVEGLKAELAQALRRGADAEAALEAARADIEALKGRAQAAETRLEDIPSPDLAASMSGRMAELEERLKLLPQAQERAAELETERAAFKADRRKAAAWLKERQAFKRRLEEIHQQLEALKL